MRARISCSHDMPVLHLGVIDQPYQTGRESTGDVAEILEGKYGVMDHFVKKHEQDIANDLENSLKGALENVLLGGPPSSDPFAAATSAIDNRFKKFLSSKEMDSLGVAGVPTQASLAGTSKRFKQKQKKDRGPRPSFIDTGLYQASFKSWVD
jgi:hypothetical protein